MDTINTDKLWDVIHAYGTAVSEFATATGQDIDVKLRKLGEAYEEIVMMIGDPPHEMDIRKPG
jgi:hypothetical protein